MTSKIETETTASESKERLRRRVVAAGSSSRIQEGVDKSCIPTHRLVILSRPERHVN
jgi:hypothetical protein